MTTREIRATALATFVIALVVLMVCPVQAQAAEMKFKTLLLWGTDESKPPAGKDYKPVEAEVRKKLKELPLKWANWFEVRRSEFTVAEGPVKRVPVSDKCELDVKYLGDSTIEVVHIGKGKEVLRRKQSLGKGEMLILGGNAPNSTAWLIVLKRLE